MNTESLPSVAETTEVKVLLVEDDPGDVAMVRHALSGSGEERYNIVHVERLETALKIFPETRPDVILLDLSLPDGVGMSTFLKIQEGTSNIPIVVLTGTDDNALALLAVEKGAQDYLCKKNLDGSLLPRVIRYAMQRQVLLNELRVLSLTDDLTGLYNRRGFIFLAQQQLEGFYRQSSRKLYFLFVDLDGMKLINDQHGHPEGDNALREFSRILKETFRSSDIIGRVGGDEFAVLVTEHSHDRLPQTLRRLTDAIEAHNTTSDRSYRLEFSVGVTPCDPKRNVPVETFLKMADDLMYEQKRAKKSRQVQLQAGNS